MAVNNAEIPGDAFKMPADPAEFAQELIKLLPGAFAEKSYVYGTIAIENTPARDGSGIISIEITFPESDRMVCFPCMTKFDQFSAYCKDPSINPPQLLAYMAGTLADAYNEEHMVDIKYSAAHARLEENMKSKDYIIKHAYPMIVSAAAVSEAIDSIYGRWVTVPLPGDINKTGIGDLAYAFMVNDGVMPMSINLRTPQCKNFTPEDYGNLVKSALVNLENSILDVLAIADAAEFSVQEAFPVELPREVSEYVLGLVKKESGLKAYTAYLRKSPLDATAILLSRLAMLKIARAVGARHELLVIPQHLAGLMVLNADDPGKIISDEKAQEAAQKYADMNPDQTRTVIARALHYNIITGEIS